MVKLVTIKQQTGSLYIDKKLQEYDFEIVHKPGTRQRNGDALSQRICQLYCCPCSRLYHEGIIASIKVTPDNWNQKMKDQQERDPALNKIREWKLADQCPTWREVSAHPTILKTYLAQWDSLTLDDRDWSKTLKKRKQRNSW